LWNTTYCSNGLFGLTCASLNLKQNIAVRAASVCPGSSRSKSDNTIGKLLTSPSTAKNASLRHIADSLPSSRKDEPHPVGGNEMRQSSPHSNSSKAGSTAGKANKTAKETDPLLQAAGPSYSLRQGTRESTRGGIVRSRRASKSPTVSINRHFGMESSQPDGSDQELKQAYNILNDDSRSGNTSQDDNSRASATSGNSRSIHAVRRNYIAEGPLGGGDHPPLLEIPEEIFGVRTAALKVLKPLTRTWVSLQLCISVYRLRLRV